MSKVGAALVVVSGIAAFVLGLYGLISGPGVSDDARAYNSACAGLAIFGMLVLLAFEATKEGA